MASTTYATITELKQRVSVEATDVTADTLLQQLLDTAAYMVDQATRRPPEGKEAFSATSSETRYFDDPRLGTVAIDDALTVTAITRGGTTITSTYYQLRPYNPGNGPYTSIQFRSDATSITNIEWYGYPHTYMGTRQIAVTGTWGYCTQANRPAVVKEATLTQAEKLYERFGISPAELLTAMRDPYKTLDPLVAAMLAPLMKGRSNFA
jgi:hypothetical protein